MYTHTQTIHNFPLKKSLTSNGQILKHPQNIMCFISGLLFCFCLCFWYFYTVCHSINERHCHWTHGTVIFISGTSFTSVGPFFIEMKKTDKCIFLMDESLRCHWSLPLGVGLVWNSSSRAVACGQSIAFKDFFFLIVTVTCGQSIAFEGWFFWFLLIVTATVFIAFEGCSFLTVATAVNSTACLAILDRPRSVPH